MKTATNSFARTMLGLLLTWGLLGQSGYAVLLVGGAAAGISGYAYEKGELKVTENAPLDRVWNAALEVMKDLQYPVTSQKKDALTAELTARTAQDKKVHMHFKGLLQNTTEVRIRIGAFGDEALSLLIEDRIKKKL